MHCEACSDVAGDFTLMHCEACSDVAEEFALLDAVPTVNTVRVDIVRAKSRGTETRRVICVL